MRNVPNLSIVSSVADRAAGHAVTAALSGLVEVAAGCGVDGLARALAGAISASDQGAVLVALRRALRARGNPATVAARLAALDAVEAGLTNFNDLLTAVADAQARELQSAGPVDLVGAAGQDARMTRLAKAPNKTKAAREPAVRTGDAWGRYVDRLIEAGDDGKLIEIAIGADFAGSQGGLAGLSGYTEESISRAKHGRPFAAVMHDWLRAYLRDPAHPPPPLPSGAGAKVRPGAIAPQVWVDARTYQRFLTQAERGKLGSQAAVVNWCIREYLGRHPDTIPEPKVPEGSSSIRVRIDHANLATLDARVGIAARAAHLRAAVVEGVAALVAS